MSLSIVEPHDDDVNEEGQLWEQAAPAPAKIPDFEGQPVDFTKAKLTSASSLEIDDQVLRLDDIVRAYVDCRVVRIDHVINERTGKLERVHTFKVIDATLVPYEEGRD
jgi:hypothetical protein